MASFADLAALPVPASRFLVRNKEGLQTFMGPPTVTPEDGIITTPRDTSNALQGVRNLRVKPVYSPGGQVVCVVSELPGTPIAIHDADSGALITSIGETSAESVEFSPLGTYLVTWSRPKTGSTAPTLLVWEVSTQICVASYQQKAQKTNVLQWTADERYCCHMVSNEVRIMRGTDLAAGAISKVFHKGISQCTVAPVAPDSTCTIGVFVPEKGGKPASASLYVFPGEGDVQGPTTSRTMFAASEVRFLWNITGTSVLCHTSSDVDHSNTSYYGASGLFLLGTFAVNNLTEKIAQSKEGPIHDVAWSPAGDKFILSAGTMPARCTLYNAKAEMIYEFGETHRNTIIWSPHGRFLCLAGFGNLAGEMDFYDTAKNSIKKMGTNSAHCTVSYGWSPDSRYFFTAILAPRMNVDNGFKVFKYNGVGPVVAQPFEQAFDFVIQPLHTMRFPSRGQSPRRDGSDGGPKPVAVAAPPVAKPAAYRPPGASAGGSGGLAGLLRKGTEVAPVGKVKPTSTGPPAIGGKNTGQGMRFAPRSIPGLAEPHVIKPKEDPAVVEAKKEAKKKAERDRKEAQALAKEAEEIAAKEAARIAALPKAIDELTVEEKEKRAKNLRKKLKVIDELKVKLASGAALNDDQMAKINNVADVIADLEKLGL